MASGSTARASTTRLSMFSQVCALARHKKLLDVVGVRFVYAERHGSCASRG